MIPGVRCGKAQSCCLAGYQHRHSRRGARYWYCKSIIIVMSTADSISYKGLTLVTWGDQ